MQDGVQVCMYVLVVQYPIQTVARDEVNIPKCFEYWNGYELLLRGM